MARTLMGGHSSPDVGDRSERYGVPTACWRAVGGWGLALLMASCTASEAPAGAARRAPQGLIQSVADVDCAEVVLAIKTRRGLAAHNAAVQLATEIRAKSPHVDVPIDKLVEFHAPIAGQGRPAVAADEDDLNVLTRHVLCDPLMLEVVTQQYLATHPEYRL